MDAERSCWHDLRDRIGEAREKAPPTADQVRNQLLGRLKRLSSGEHPRCSSTVQGWLQSTKGRRLIEIALARSADGKDSWLNPAIALQNLHYLEDGATLRIAVTVSERAPKGIRAYTVALEGKARSSQKHWYGQVHLTEGPEGAGLCGHALLHCHVGSSPEEATEESDAAGQHPLPASGEPPRKHRPFSPRVPLPWLTPWEALEWLLATVDPDLEPAPVSALPEAR
jgi:hypothetical protein